MSYNNGGLLEEAYGDVKSLSGAGWNSKALLLGVLLVSGLIASCSNQEEPLVLDLKSSPILATDPQRDEEGIRFAIAPVISPEKGFASYRLFMKYLAERLKRPVVLVQRKTYLEVNELLRNGTVHLALVCTGAFVIGNRDFGMDVVAVPRYQGKAQYYSLIIVRKESPIRNIMDLQGKRMALTDPLSNSGYFYPMFLIREMGKDPNQFFSRMLFTYSHDSSMQAVLEGIADVAAVDSLIFDHEVAQNGRLSSALRVIHKSPPFGINPVVASRKTPRSLVEDVRRILLGMDEDVEGRSILNLLRIEDFIEPPERMYEATKKMILQMRAVEGPRE